MTRLISFVNLLEVREDIPTNNTLAFVRRCHNYFNALLVVSDDILIYVHIQTNRFRISEILSFP